MGLEKEVGSVGSYPLTAVAFFRGGVDGRDGDGDEGGERDCWFPSGLGNLGPPSFLSSNSQCLETREDTTQGPLNASPDRLGASAQTWTFGGGELSGTRLASTTLDFDAATGLSARLRARIDWAGGGRESFRGNWDRLKKKLMGQQTAAAKRLCQA